MFEIYYKNANQDGVDISSSEYKNNMEQARKLLGKAIPMWIKYSNSKPSQSWMVIHLLKDALFELNRYDELEKIIKEILQKFIYIKYQVVSLLI